MAQEEFVTPLYPAPKEGSKADKPKKVDAAVNANGLEYLEAAPSKPVVWEKGLLFAEFKKRSSTQLEPPAPWNPDLGTTEEGTYETAEDIDNELKLQLAIVLEQQKSAASSSSAASSIPTQPMSQGSRPPQAGASSAASKGTTQSTSRRPRKIATSDVQTEPTSQLSQRSKGRCQLTALRCASSSCNLAGSKKRLAPASADVPASKKLKLSESTTSPPTVTPAAVQLGEYAAESLYNTFGRDHVLGLLVTGKYHHSLV